MLKIYFVRHAMPCGATDYGYFVGQAMQIPKTFHTAFSCKRLFVIVVDELRYPEEHPANHWQILPTLCQAEILPDKPKARQGAGFSRFVGLSGGLA